MPDQDQQDHQDQSNPQPQADSPQADPPQPSLDDELANAAAALDRGDAGDSNSATTADGETPSETPTEEAKAGDSDSPPEEKPKPEPKPSAWASLRKREQTLVEKQNAWQSEREDALKQVNEWKELQARCKDDPWAALRAIGWEDGKAFLQAIADNGGQMTPEQKRIYELEKQVAEDRKTRETAETQAKQAQQEAEMQVNLKSWHAAIRQNIDASPELKDSLVGVADTEPAVFQVMQAHYQETGEQMDYTDAAKKVAQNMEARVEGVLNELVSNKRGLELLRKLAPKLSPPAPARQRAPRGITQNISNSTGATRQKPRSLDEVVAEQAAWLDSR